ncbi:MAG: zinc-finger domain-containing protein [Rickettsiales bacterium]
MTNHKTNEKFFEEVVVSSSEVVCDGGGASFGHPRVYLHIEREKGYIVCPYCSRSYILKSSH